MLMGAAAITAVLVALLLSGCGRGASTSTSTRGSAGNEHAQGDGSATVDCGGSVYDAAALTDALPVSSLPKGPREAVDDAGAPAFNPAQDWNVVHQDANRVDLVRELEEPLDNRDGAGDVHTHESRTLERITGASNVPEGTWLLTSAGPCVQRLVGDDGLGPADVTLADTPAQDETALDLLVREQACASGRSAEGRIEVVELEETAEQVRLRLMVERLDGDQSCQGNPATPLTVQLADPLGDREVLDSSVVPARPVAVGSPE
jgi:hypothetical protein